jgi:hypothetical protein
MQSLLLAVGMVKYISGVISFTLVNSVMVLVMVFVSVSLPFYRFRCVSKTYCKCNYLLTNYGNGRSACYESKFKEPCHPTKHGRYNLYGVEHFRWKDWQ